MCVWICSHICTPSLHVGVYRFTYMHSVYICVGICVYIYARQVYMCVGVQECFICVCRCIHIYMYTWKISWVHTDTLSANRNTCIRIFVVRVVVCIHMYTYIYEKTPCVHTNLHVCVYILACMHADFTCGCVDVWMYAWVCWSIYIYARRVYTCIYTYLHVWSPSLFVCVYIITYMHTEF